MLEIIEDPLQRLRLQNRLNFPKGIKGKWTDLYYRRDVQNS